jgi:hypothetical protein
LISYLIASLARAIPWSLVIIAAGVAMIAQTVGIDVLGMATDFVRSLVWDHALPL